MSFFDSFKSKSQYLYRTIRRKVVFFIGDIHSQRSFPYCTWSVKKHQIDFDEVLSVLPEIKYGDVGIHRDNGYLSNVFIPGFMKHAWIHTEDGLSKPQIVEAVSEGVIERSAIYPIYSDFCIILSPKGVTDEERKGACLKAKGIIGAAYGDDFKFDIDEEIKHYTGRDKDAAISDLKHYEDAVNKYTYTFSCSEAVSYAWWHKREELNLFLKERKGYDCILADDLLNKHWEIKWMSKSVTAETAAKIGLHAEGVEMITQFLEKQKYKVH